MRVYRSAQPHAPFTGKAKGDCFCSLTHIILFAPVSFAGGVSFAERNTQCTTSSTKRTTTVIQSKSNTTPTPKTRANGIILEHSFAVIHAISSVISIHLMAQTRSLKICSTSTKTMGWTWLNCSHALKRSPSSSLSISMITPDW